MRSTVSLSEYKRLKAQCAPDVTLPDHVLEQAISVFVQPQVSVFVAVDVQGKRDYFPTETLAALLTELQHRRREE